MTGIGAAPRGPKLRKISTISREARGSNGGGALCRHSRPDTGNAIAGGPNCAGFRMPV